MVNRISSMVTVILVLAPTAMLAQLAPAKAYATAESAYRELSLMTYDARKIAFKELSPETQDEVWLIHLKRYLSERADLTDSERSVILEGMGLLYAGLARVNRDDPAWALKVYRPLQALQVRANTECRPEIIKAAFGVLGPSPSDGAEKVSSSSSHSKVVKIAPQVGPSWGPCTCNQDHDFCGEITSPMACRGLPCDRSDYGCGWLWLQECNGICL